MDRQLGYSRLTGLLLCFLLLLLPHRVGADTIYYEYDAQGRLKQAEDTANDILYAYAYDIIGNRQMAATITSQQPGPIAWYPFSEGSGTTAADATGNGHGGTLINEVAWTPDGVVGSALSFDGVDDYVLIPDHDDLDLTGTFTLAAWVNTDLSQPGTLLSKDGVGGDYTGAYNVYLTKTAYEVPYTQYETNNLGSLYAYWGLTENTWHHVVVTFDAMLSPTMRIYIDGIERGSGDVAAPITLSTDLLLGRRGWDADPRHFKGLLDEMQVYNRRLSASEVAASYYSYRDPGDSPWLVAAYPLNEGQGTIATDTSGNGRDGTITNAVWTSSGIEGTALDFDGDGDYVELPHPGELREGSMAAWIAPATVTPGESWFAVTLGSEPIGGGGDGVNLGVHAYYSDHLAFGIYSTQWNWADSGITPQAGEWYHVVGTWGPEGLKIYVNGELTGTHPYQGGIPSSTQYAYLAANTWDQYFSSRMDEVNIYNYALSAAEARSLYTDYKPGLIASYPFSEGTGTTTADTSGHGYDGTLLNGVTWTSDGVVGNALSFDGVDDYVDVGVYGALQIGTGNFSVAAWGQHPEASYWSILAADRNAGYAEGWFLGLDSSGKLVCTVEDAAGNARYYYSTPEYDDDQWHHFACTWEAALQELRIYADGQEVALASSSVTIGTVGSIAPATPLNIGRQPNGQSYWQGLIDEVNLYNRALSATEIQALYNASGGAAAAPAMLTLSTAPEAMVGAESAEYSVTLSEADALAPADSKDPPAIPEPSALILLVLGLLGLGVLRNVVGRR